MSLIKQALYEWVTVISAEEDTYTWWGWSVVLAFVTWSACLEVEQSAPGVPVFSPPHNGGNRVENRWIMKSLTQGHAHMLHPPYLCKTLLRLCTWAKCRTQWSWILQVLQCCYYGKLLPLLPLNCTPLILSYINSPKQWWAGPWG